MEIELMKTASSVGESCLHLQLTPAYRKDIFVDEQVRELTKIYFAEKAKKLGVFISAMEVGHDHFHVFLVNWKKYSVEKLANEFKGFTSYMMRKFHRELFREKLWGKKFWSEGYFYRTVGVVTREAVQFYIQHSQKKHWKAVDYGYYRAKQQRILSEFN